VCSLLSGVLDGVFVWGRIMGIGVGGCLVCVGVEDDDYIVSSYLDTN
jgi:hypothetical protein